MAHGLVCVGRPVDADYPGAPVEGPIVLDDQRVLLHLADDPRDHPPQLRIRLLADSVGPDGEKVIVAVTGSSQLFVLLLILGDDPAVVVQDYIAPDDVTPVVLVGDVGVEADETR